jgi:carbonic anhydrase
MINLQHIIERNHDWAAKMKDEQPDFFLQLSEQQNPEYLWIGCADSRVPANQIINLPPGEVFVHRNIANVVVHTDLNCLSVIQYAVDILKVKHIIVCGHYGCGGIKAALDSHEHGLIDNWLRHIKDVNRFHLEKFKGLNSQEKEDLLCELNVVEQVTNVCNSTIVQRAWRRGESLTVHGWVYGVHDGILKDMGVSISSLEQLYTKIGSISEV